MVDRFEAMLAAHAGRGALATSSGTAALHLALRVLGVEPGDEVVCSTLTFAASITPAVHMGARPVFVECSAETWCMCPDALDTALSAHPRVKVVVAVDLYGQCADYDALEAVCEKHGAALVVDAAEALGATYKGRPAGAAGAAGFYSFNGNKIVTTSGGGALLMADAAMLARARKLAQQAREPAPWYEHAEAGFNYRLSNVLAGIGVGQMEQLPGFVAKRRQIFEWYVQNLHGLVDMMPEAGYGKSSRWLTVCKMQNAKCKMENGGKPSERVMRVVNAHDAANIESRPVWKPMHLQPVFAGCPCYGTPVSGEIFYNGLCLPSGTAMTGDDVAEVCGIVRSAV
jgi:pyridoxal phosphate-dependent aminotransferase EpsN